MKNKKRKVPLRLAWSDFRESVSRHWRQPEWRQGSVLMGPFILSLHTQHFTTDSIVHTQS